MKNVLTAKVSWFLNYNSVVPSGELEIGKLLRSTANLSTIETIRQTPEKAIRDALKATLPAFTPSCICTRRNKQNVVQHSGLIQFDIDAKENPTHQDWKKLKKIICYSPNVAYCGLSVSGNGLWGLIAITFPDRHKEHFEYIRKYFECEGIVIDKAPSSIVSLRGISYDPNGYFNPQAEPLRQFYERPPLVQELRHSQYGDAPPWEIYNRDGKIEDLLNEAGWKIAMRKGPKTYFTRPGKTKGVSAEYDENRGVFFVFTSGTQFQPTKGYSPFQIYALLKHHGDYKAAARTLKTQHNYRKI